MDSVLKIKCLLVNVVAQEWFAVFFTKLSEKNGALGFDAVLKRTNTSYFVMQSQESIN